MTFIFGERSEKELVGVHPDLVRVVRRALELSPVDFGVHDGLRTVAEQQAYVDAGVSWTMNGRHLTGHAVDLIPYINGKLRWEWPPIFKIAAAMKQAATEFSQTIRWGGVWDMRLEELGDDLEAAEQAYIERRRLMGKKAAVDGPHFELPEKEYPA
jgi:peptidoglycan L-alanyl-D-glutamate endopeptidase CwlK